jgi:hypothetical protein
MPNAAVFETAWHVGQSDAVRVVLRQVLVSEGQERVCDASQ